MRAGHARVLRRVRACPEEEGWGSGSTSQRLMTAHCMRTVLLMPTWLLPPPQTLVTRQHLTTPLPSSPTSAATCKDAGARRAGPEQAAPPWRKSKGKGV
jgi:hypothetical protein